MNDRWNKETYFWLFLVLLIFVQSFEGLCVVVFGFGFCYEAWMSIMWTLIYDLFPGSDASDAMGILQFCWGISSFVISIFETLILNATGNDSSSLSSSQNLSTTGSPTLSTTIIEVSSSVYVEPLVTPSMNGTSSNRAVIGTQRSFGNQMVMVMLCAFLFLAFLSQCVMYFIVIRKMPSIKDDERKEKTIDCGHSNTAFE